MSRQTNIKQFFTTAPQKKRAATQNPEATEKDSVPSTSGSAVEPTLKKARTGSGDFKMVSNEIVKVKENSQNLVSLKAELVEQWKALRLLHPDFGLTWFKALKQEFSKEYFTTLSKFVVAERASRTVYPPPHQVFSWTQKFAIEQTKVVILGQDPYHGPGQAHGLCFSVPVGVPPPPSLVNIYKEIRSDIPGTVLPTHGNLSGWADQGVLLLNACLTVRAGEANSHKNQGWEQFTDAVVTWLNENLTGVVFLLWGRYAQVKGAKINKSRHHVLTAGHPSPLSVQHFQGCKHFSRTNELLLAGGKVPIDWGKLDAV